ncbi:MAG: hypothetical protein Q4A71_05335 [Actinomycetaceae bacterium]|nr:hypothetical protein [Actinomycetaceae bacterium]
MSEQDNLDNRAVESDGANLRFEDAEGPTIDPAEASKLAALVGSAEPAGDNFEGDAAFSVSAPFRFVQAAHRQPVIAPEDEIGSAALANSTPASAMAPQTAKNTAENEGGDAVNTAVDDADSPVENADEDAAPASPSEEPAALEPNTGAPESATPQTIDSSFPEQSPDERSEVERFPAEASPVTPFQPSEPSEPYQTPAPTAPNPAEPEETLAASAPSAAPMGVPTDLSTGNAPTDYSADRSTAADPAIPASPTQRVSLAQRYQSQTNLPKVSDDLENTMIRRQSLMGNDAVLPGAAPAGGPDWVERAEPEITDYATPPTEDEAIFAGATVVPTVKKRGWNHFWNIVLSVLGYPLVLVLFAVGIHPTAQSVYVLPSSARVPALIFALILLFFVAWHARYSSVGSFIMGSVLTILGLVGLFTTSIYERGTLTVNPLGIKYTNVPMRIEGAIVNAANFGTTGLLAVIGLFVLAIAFVSHGARRQGRAETRTRETVEASRF